MGDGYVAIKMFIQHSNNHPEVLKMFQKQLEQREKPKFTRSEKKENKKNPQNRLEKTKTKSKIRKKVKKV